MLTIMHTIRSLISMGEKARMLVYEVVKVKGYLARLHSEPDIC